MNATAQLTATVRTLTAARRNAGISQAALAARLGKSRETINRWETWATWPSIGDLVAWAAALNCELAVTGPVASTHGKKDVSMTAQGKRIDDPLADLEPRESDYGTDGATGVATGIAANQQIGRALDGLPGGGVEVLADGSILFDTGPIEVAVATGRYGVRPRGPIDPGRWDDSLSKSGAPTRVVRERRERLGGGAGRHFFIDNASTRGVRWPIAHLPSASWPTATQWRRALPSARPRPRWGGRWPGRAGGRCARGGIGPSSRWRCGAGV